jgi:transcription initiation factor TFIIB
MQYSSLCSICEDDSRLVTDSGSGEIICSNCGMVISDKAQHINRPGWHFFNSNNNAKKELNDKRRTVGGHISLARYDMGLATVIGRTDRDAYGRKISVAMRTTMQRLRIWDLRAHIHSSADRNLIQAFNELDILKDKLALPYVVVQKAAYIYRKARHKGLSRGRTTSGLLAATIYAACREMETPRTLNDITEVSNNNRKNIARNYRLLVSELSLKVPNIDPMRCICRVAGKANLTENTKRQALSIMNIVTKKEISAGKDPMGLAASVLYMSCLKTRERRTQMEIAHSAGVSEVTVRNRYIDLKSKLKLNDDDTLIGDGDYGDDTEYRFSERIPWSL